MGEQQGHRCRVKRRSIILMGVGLSSFRAVEKKTVGGKGMTLREEDRKW